jgi:hypothetical protein
MNFFITGSFSPLNIKCDISVNLVTMLCMACREIGVLQPEAFRPARGSSQPPRLRTLEVPSLGTKRPECEAGVEVKNVCSCIFTPPCAFMA